ncbi:longitudinals lacking protein, isoforms A/B/D/L-like isoform X11 [Vespa velutina]|uniref:longitudinals lacking protein, isoforms A/B/D/L-like isoform X11 n=1 Tax=Vespa velutina TaxID=202808 RepID=UPI001FB56270|nr:longitudinals lacking protein, isoforms A/B/D/L-like isoform X11 [Vespa velutina]
MEDDQQFCLKWNNHQSTLIQNFDTLYESGTLVDCTLAAEGKYLKAHRVVLSACSPYFEGLLSEHYDKHPVFILKDVKFKELKAMMDYMYRGEVNISQDQLTALLKAAESLQIKGLSESKTGGGNNKTVSRVSKVAPQPRSSPLNISYASSGLTIERNRVPRQAQSSIGDLPEDSHSPQIPKELSSREGSQSPTSKKRRRLRRRSVGEDNSVENHEASNSSDIPQQMGVPALAIAPVADEKTNADPTDSLGRSALMTQLTKPADEMLQIPLENPEPNDNLIEPKSEYLEDQEESVEDLTLDDDMNDLNEIEQDTNRAGPSHDNSQHPAGLATWHVTGDRSNAGGVVGSVAGAPGTTDEVFLAAQEAAQAHRDSQDPKKKKKTTTTTTRTTLRFDDKKYDNEIPVSVPWSMRRRMMMRRSVEEEEETDVRRRQEEDEEEDEANEEEEEEEEEEVAVEVEVDHHNHHLHHHLRHRHHHHHHRILPFAGLKIPKASSFNYIGKKPVGQFACNRCGRSYMRKDSLQRHTHWECGKEPQFHCPFCPQRCKRKAHWLRHIRRQHFEKIGDMEAHLLAYTPKLEID